MMVSWTNACSSTYCKGLYPSFTDVWAADFVQPTDRVNAYPAGALSASGMYCGPNFYDYVGTGQPCATGGVYDKNIQAACPGSGGAPNCVFYAEFNHFWVWNTSACPTYDRRQWNATSGCLEDEGPAAVIYNLSGVSTGTTAALSSTNLSTWLGSTFYGELHHVLALCKPLSGYFGTTPGATVYPNQATTTQVCAANTAADIYNGSAIDWSTPLSSILGDELPDTSAIVLVK